VTFGLSRYRWYAPNLSLWRLPGVKPASFFYCLMNLHKLASRLRRIPILRFWQDNFRVNVSQFAISLPPISLFFKSYKQANGLDETPHSQKNPALNIAIVLQMFVSVKFCIAKAFFCQFAFRLRKTLIFECPCGQPGLVRPSLSVSGCLWLSMWPIGYVSGHPVI
jgi:hypothetical protein